jgi:hypothetical protein
VTACQEQAVLQLMQITPFQAMHSSRERTARPIAVGGSDLGAVADGQAS